MRPDQQLDNRCGQHLFDENLSRQFKQLARPPSRRLGIPNVDHHTTSLGLVLKV